jgi:DNA-binding response OmpR family regulator
MNRPEIQKCIVAIVDDEDELCAEIAAFLEMQGYKVWTADSAEAFYREKAIKHCDLVIVDLGLPGEDGLSLIEHLNSNYLFPIIALTARGAVSDRIAGLEAGADYYFVKPVDLFELVAGIKTVLRKRVTTNQTPTEAKESWQIFRADAVLITPLGAQVNLTSREVQLLEYLMSSPETVFTKKYLLKHFCLLPEENNFHSIEAVIARLRAKVAEVSTVPLPLRTVYGKGVSFVGNCTVSR